ncbi:MAG TPA: hypothetical protein VIW01_13665 [Dehalococcoidia bacterium]
MEEDREGEPPPHEAPRTMSGAPEHVVRLSALMSTFDAPWALCGGWAVDAWIGRQTREHGDIDIIVFQDDQQTLFDHLAGWTMIAHGPYAGDADERWDGRRLELPVHIHIPAKFAFDNGRVYSEDGFTLEAILNELSGGDWVLRREPMIGRDLSSCVRRSDWDIPTVVPEVLLFFKSLDLRGRDRADFAALLPKLTATQRAWLREAVTLLGHPWEAQLR